MSSMVSTVKSIDSEGNGCWDSAPLGLEFGRAGFSGSIFRGRAGGEYDGRVWMTKRVRRLMTTWIKRRILSFVAYPHPLLNSTDAEA